MSRRSSLMQGDIERRVIDTGLAATDDIHSRRTPLKSPSCLPPARAHRCLPLKAPAVIASDETSGTFHVLNKMCTMSSAVERSSP